MLRIAGMRIATVAALPRNDSVFTTACVYSDAKPYRYVIARERSDRGNPFPLILHFAFCIFHLRSISCAINSNLAFH